MKVVTKKKTVNRVKVFLEEDVILKFNIESKLKTVEGSKLFLFLLLILFFFPSLVIED